MDVKRPHFEEVHAYYGIVVRLGGSATNDAGVAYVVGVKFFDNEGQSFISIGATLKNVSRIDMRVRDPLLDDIEITAMCVLGRILKSFMIKGLMLCSASTAWRVIFLP